MPPDARRSPDVKKAPEMLMNCRKNFHQSVQSLPVIAPGLLQTGNASRSTMRHRRNKQGD
jgi:hypothetical protein